MIALTKAGGANVGDFEEKNMTALMLLPKICVMCNVMCAKLSEGRGVEMENSFRPS